MALIKTNARGQSSNLGRRNLIINGAMQVSQRHGSNVYAQINDGLSLDRFKGNTYDGGIATGKYTVQQSSTAPDDFSHSLLVTSSASTADNANNIFNIEQRIEGYNTAHLNFGSSSAKTITLSFYVRSSLTGTFGGALKNSDRNRAYPFSYTINSANTFERKTITISGDTTGTWVGSTNGMGLWVSFGLGVGSTRSGTSGAWGGGDMFSSTGATSVIGTSGATWFLTGLQVEVGDTATPFEHRSYGEELALCQRYYERWARSGNLGVTMGHTFSTGNSYGIVNYKTKRASPDCTSSTGLWRIRVGGVGNNETTTTLTFANVGLDTARVLYTGNGTSAGATGWIVANHNAYVEFDAEL